jgi:hemerythrin-like domain-containing protein
MSSDDHAPIQSFSNCHSGILDAMRELAELPALLGPARRVRSISERFGELYQKVILEHHREEEKDLFPAVLADAQPGAERTEVDRIVTRLTREHREVEAAFAKLLPAVRAVGKNLESELNLEEIEALASKYIAHARFEEEEFLPLAKTILGRNSDHMAALGLSIHMRRSADDIRREFGAI